MSNTTVDTIYQGRVKWFNNKAGYGFVTVIEGADSADNIGTDIFAHHSAIRVSEEQYKYLVQGEYIEFSISPVESTADYKYQAVDVKGMKGGKLLCETRNEARANMPQRTHNTSQGRGRQQSRPRGTGPRANMDETDEWSMANSKPTLQRQNSLVEGQM